MTVKGFDDAYQREMGRIADRKRRLIAQIMDGAAAHPPPDLEARLALVITRNGVTRRM